MKACFIFIEIVKTKLTYTLTCVCHVALNLINRVTFVLLGLVHLSWIKRTHLYKRSLPMTETSFQLHNIKSSRKIQTQKLSQTD